MLKDLTCQRIIERMSVLQGVRVLTPMQAHETRQGYTRDLRHSFRKEALRHLSPKEQARYGDDLSIHHIVPISLGGSNDVSNLALLHKDFHAWVHLYIDHQLHGLRYNEWTAIWLPRWHETIWDLKSIDRAPS